MRQNRFSNLTDYKIVIAIVVCVFLQMGAVTAFADDLVQQVQESLIDKGYNPGLVDGVWGAKTKNALQKFQQDEGISGKGKLDDETKNRLLNSKIEEPAVDEFNPAYPDASDDKISWGRHKS